MGLRQQERWKLDWGKDWGPGRTAPPVALLKEPCARGQDGSHVSAVWVLLKVCVWALDGDSEGKPARRWESSPVGMNGMSLLIVIGCPVAPGHSVQKRGLCGLSVAISDSLRSTWAVRGSYLPPRPPQCCEVLDGT